MPIALSKAAAPSSPTDKSGVLARSSQSGGSILSDATTQRVIVYGIHQLLETCASNS